MPCSARSLVPAVAVTVALAAVGGGTAVAAPAAHDNAPVVKGAILARYDALGGAQSYLGAPLTSETPTPVRTGAYNVFQAGSIYWSPTTGAWDLHGLILANWAALGFENSVLGFPTSGENALAGDARFQSFERGLSYYSPASGAHEVHGAILAEYAALGYERSRLGLPVTNETPTPDGLGRYELFEHGSIYWTPITGAHEVLGSILAKWASIGYERSVLSYPTSDPVAVAGGGRESTFLLGTITSTPSTGALVTRFIAPVSSVDRPGSAFTVQLLKQTFHYDANDTFLLATASTLGSPGSPVPPAPPTPLTEAQFTNDLGIDTFVVGMGYSPDPKATSTFEILDIAGVGLLSPAARSAYLRR